MNYKIKQLLNIFEKIYLLPEAKELLSPQWKLENNRPNMPASTGFCYIATEALYHMLKIHKPKIMCASYVENKQHCTHWWLIINNEIIDPTASQYINLKEKVSSHHSQVNELKN